MCSCQYRRSWTSLTTPLVSAQRLSERTVELSTICSTLTVNMLAISMIYLHMPLQYTSQIKIHFLLSLQWSCNDRPYVTQPRNVPCIQGYKRAYDTIWWLPFVSCAIFGSELLFLVMSKRRFRKCKVRTDHLQTFSGLENTNAFTRLMRFAFQS
jgi:hypothetical protein